MQLKHLLVSNSRWVFGWMASVLMMPSSLPISLDPLALPILGVHSPVCQQLDTPEPSLTETSDTTTAPAEDGTDFPERPKILNQQGRWIVGVLVFLSAGVWGAYWLRQTRDPHP
jgi:hypothetical protein